MPQGIILFLQKPRPQEGEGGGSGDTYGGRGGERELEVEKFALRDIRTINNFPQHSSMCLPRIKS